MEEKDVIQLLRHYRHDLMNHLQIVQGYLSMGKTDKVQKKVKNYLQQLQEESKLVNLNAPFFALYLLQFGSLHMNFRLTYHIHTENKNLQSVDQLLTDYCKQVMEKIKNATDETELYELDVRLSDVSPVMIELEFTVNGHFPDVSSFRQNMEDNDQEIAIFRQKNELKCIARVTYK
ncbi:stage 0 sporulation protein B (sporulation initiation phosphotransferase) [Lentibacillus halodurans]|uniref:Stage 0 sporulation protein B (Sporulation initiation phosphotransferase) n=1 Tax=Lentibacillus halodurans TaxID=237679 RepID=A0A1I0UYE1_9BACI|nr:Spo0B domain-containing protein [Lentibacillus halodurans]SFA69022.1 stage 0 sporulation protein B (sporulation initiation phosphotransferase) [Lentibacillus halodurans]